MTITDKMNSFYYHMSLYELQMMNGSDYFNGLSYNSLLYINVIEQLEDWDILQTISGYNWRQLKNE